MNINDYSIAYPGRIVEFFPATQTATVQISAERIYNTSEKLNELTDRKPIEDVPVHVSSGGGWSLTMPIQVGDTCLIMFSQIGYDHWFYEDKDSAGTLARLPKPWLRRCFSEDDGFCLVGFNTLKRSIQTYSAADSEWRNADATQSVSLKSNGDIVVKAGANEIALNSTGIEITGDLTVNGNIKSTGLINSGTVSLDLHTHIENGTGGGITNPPTPVPPPPA